MARQKANVEDGYPECMRCKARVPRIDVIDVSSLTAKADWWRDMPGMIKICPQCSKELSDIVDKWWLQLGKSRFNKES